MGKGTPPSDPKQQTSHRSDKLVKMFKKITDAVHITNVPPKVSETKAQLTKPSALNNTLLPIPQPKRITKRKHRRHLSKNQKKDKTIAFEQAIITKMHEEKAPLHHKNKKIDDAIKNQDEKKSKGLHQISIWLSTHVPLLRFLQNKMVLPIIERNQQAKNHWLASLTDVKRLFVSANDPKHYQPKRTILRFSKPVMNENKTESTQTPNLKPKPKLK